MTVQATRTVNLFSPEAHLSVMWRCASPSRAGHRILLAAPPGSRYPYMYPRDAASTARVLLQLIERNVAREEAFAHLEATARFLASCQRPDGYWGQRYALTGEDKSIYRQEDNVAHGILVIASYLEACARLNREPDDKEALLDVLERAWRHGLEASFRPGINLFYSTTSIHESAIEQGYTLWTNFAHHRSHQLMLNAIDRFGGSKRLHDEVDRFREMHGKNLRRHFVQDGLFIRRLTPTGRYDRRPDVTLLSPFYFGCADLDPQALSDSVSRIEKDLWDPELGLLQRYLPFAEDRTIHLHAGNGPWMAYSAIFAQYHAVLGNREKSRMVLKAIASYATPEGEIPEHLSTRQRFRDFLKREWETGLDFEKEFDQEILLPGTKFSKIVEELNHMRDEYLRIERADPDGPDHSVIRFATPLLWSHAEFLSALLWLDK
ncbi:MAG TPA: glucoamylase [Candidatus Thermoplasmatota archaeon]|nr:glucoamylase [Candidatus Thermoplasmatota archaeon]